MANELTQEQKNAKAKLQIFFKLLGRDDLVNLDYDLNPNALNNNNFLRAITKTGGIDLNPPQNETVRKNRYIKKELAEAFFDYIADKTELNKLVDDKTITEQDKKDVITAILKDMSILDAAGTNFDAKYNSLSWIFEPNNFFNIANNTLPGILSDDGQNTANIANRGQNTNTALTAIHKTKALAIFEKLKKLRKSNDPNNPKANLLASNVSLEEFADFVVNKRQKDAENLNLSAVPSAKEPLDYVELWNLFDHQTFKQLRMSFAPKEENIEIFSDLHKYEIAKYNNEQKIITEIKDIVDNPFKDDKTALKFNALPEKFVEKVLSGEQLEFEKLNEAAHETEILKRYKELADVFTEIDKDTSVNPKENTKLIVLNNFLSNYLNTVTNQLKQNGIGFYANDRYFSKYNFAKELVEVAKKANDLTAATDGEKLKNAMDYLEARMLGLAKEYNISIPKWQVGSLNFDGNEIKQNVDKKIELQDLAQFLQNGEDINKNFKTIVDNLSWHQIAQINSEYKNLGRALIEGKHNYNNIDKDPFYTNNFAKSLAEVLYKDFDFDEKNRKFKDKNQKKAPDKGGDEEDEEYLRDRLDKLEKDLEKEKNKPKTTQYIQGSTPPVNDERSSIDKLNNLLGNSMHASSSTPKTRIISDTRAKKEEDNTFLYVAGIILAIVSAIGIAMAAGWNPFSQTSQQPPLNSPDINSGTPSPRVIAPNPPTSNLGTLSPNTKSY